ELARAFNIPTTQVKCITHYMGGGFGSKFGPDSQGIAAAHLAKKAKAPVKLMLTREEEITTAGNRPSAYGKVKIAGTKDGKVTAYQIDCYGSPGVGAAATGNLGLLPFIYSVPHFRRQHPAIPPHAAGPPATRAPGH